MNTNTQNVQLIQAKKLSQLDSVSDIFEIDGSDVILQIPKEDKNGWDNESYITRKIKLKDFISNAISTLWKNNYNTQNLNDNDLIPIIPQIQNGVSGDIINTRNNDNTLNTSIGKTKSISLNKIAQYIKNVLKTVNLEVFNSQIQSIYTDITTNDNKHIEAERTLDNKIDLNIQKVKNEHNDSISVINATFNSINTHIQTIDTDITNINNDTENINTSIQNINTDITNINNDIESIDTDITNINNDINDINSSLDNKLEEIIIDDKQNSFIGNNNVQYYLSVSENNKIHVVTYIALTDVNISSDSKTSWERDLNSQTNITWKGIFIPAKPTGTITKKWTVVNPAGAYISGSPAEINQIINGETLTWSNIPTNAAITANFVASQVDGNNESEPITKSITVTTSWWTRKWAVYVSSLDLTVPSANGSTGSNYVTGDTSGGFALNICGQEYDIVLKDAYIPPSNTNKIISLSFTSSKSFANNAVYSGYIYIIRSENVASFKAYVVKNGEKGLAQETFTRVSTNKIKTYTNNTQILYLYKSNGVHSNIQTLGFVF